MAELNVINKKTSSSYMTSLVFLIIVIVSTVGLNYYNNSLITEVESIKNSINTIDDNIAEVEKDKNLQIYSLLELNKWVIESYEKMNNITKYINHMNIISRVYDLEFTGFNLSNWVLSTNIEIMSDDNWIAYVKTKDFIKKYRNDAKALFDLSFINSVEWMDIMKFKVDFKIK